MNFYKKTALAALFQCLIAPSVAFADNKYWQEFKQFRESPSYQLVFDKKSEVSGIARDLENAKQLGLIGRLARPVIGLLGGVIVTSENMPIMYQYIDNLCKENGIATPVITVAQEKGFFNAAAQKLLMSTGAIIIGQDILKELDEQAVEAVIAHELGHVKHDHVNKMIALRLAAWYAIKAYDAMNNQVRGLASNLIALDVIQAILIGKSFERQADAFACNEANRAQGTVAFFEYILNKEKKEDADFDQIYSTLVASSNQIGIIDNAILWARYGVAKAEHQIGNGYKWLYHHTPYGSHPSPQERIATAKAVLAKQAAKRAEQEPGMVVQAA